jgi:hypothetical protein
MPGIQTLLSNLQIRRGTAGEVAAISLLDGEFAWDTTNDYLYIGYGDAQKLIGGVGAMSHTLDSAIHSDVTAITEAQGQVLYYNGSNWDALGPGTSGWFLKTQGAGANPVWAAAGVGNHTLDGSEHTDVAAITEATGQIIQYGGANWQSLSPGAAGTYLKSQGAGSVLVWATPAGSGDVVGPAGATDNAIVRYDGATGKLVQDSGITITDANVLTLAGNLDMSAGAYDILIPDNNAAALDILEGANSYFKLITTDGSEEVVIGKKAKIAGRLDLDGNLVVSTQSTNIEILDDSSAALKIVEGANSYLIFVTTNAGEKITLGKKLEAGAVEIEGDLFDIGGGEIDNTVIGANIAAAGSFTTVDIDGGNIDGTVLGAATPAAGNFTTVDIDGGSIDSVTIGAAIAAAGTFNAITLTGDLTFTTNALDILLKDNEAAALEIAESSNKYMTFVTTNGSEEVQTNKGMQFDLSAYFDAEFDNGNSGAADTIDWGVGNKQKSTLTANCTYTFTAPAGATNLMFRLVQGGSGSYTVTWPATVHWAGGTEPTLSTAVGAVDLIGMYWDGTNYHASAHLDSKSP